MKVCKFKRKLKTQAQYRLCNGKRCDNAENVTYFWARVTCSKCAKKGPWSK